MYLGSLTKEEYRELMHKIDYLESIRSIEVSYEVEVIDDKFHVKLTSNHTLAELDAMVDEETSKT